MPPWSSLRRSPCTTCTEPIVIEIDEQWLATVSRLGIRTLNPAPAIKRGRSTSGLMGRGPIILIDVANGG
jgi:hypothetical protein